MQTYQPNLFTRPDTLLGVCQGVGEDLGFSPTWLRVAFACGVFFNFGATVAVYLGLGALVMASRLLFRAPRKLVVETVAEPVVLVAPVEAAPALVDARNDDILMAAAA